MKITLSELRQLVRNEVRNTNKFLLKETVEQNKQKIVMILNGLNETDMDRLDYAFLAAGLPKEIKLDDLEDKFVKIAYLMNVVKFMDILPDKFSANKYHMQTHRIINLNIATVRNNLNNLAASLRSVNTGRFGGTDELLIAIIDKLELAATNKDFELDTNVIAETCINKIKEFEEYISEMVKTVFITWRNGSKTQELKNAFDNLLLNDDAMFISGFDNQNKELSYFLIGLYFYMQKPKSKKTFYGVDQYGDITEKFFEDLLEDYYGSEILNLVRQNYHSMRNILAAARKHKMLRPERQFTGESRSRRNNSNSITISELRQLVRSELKRSRSRY
jgi:hypothetical protein